MLAHRAARPRGAGHRARPAGPLELEWVAEGAALPAEPDWVVIATKISQTPQAWARVAASAHPETKVLLAQNGIDHRERFAELGGQRAVSALIHFNVERSGPGSAQVNGEGRGVVLPGGDLGQEAAVLFCGSEMAAVVSEDFHGEAWRKLLVNLTNPLTALTAQRMGVLAVPEMAELCRGLVREATAVARAEGVRIDEAEVDGIIEWIFSAPPQVAPSMLQDRLAGRPMEHEGLFGPVQRLAGLHGLEVPRLDAVVALLNGVEFVGGGSS